MDFLEPVKIEAERFNGINKSVVKIFAFMNKEGVVASSLLANAFVKKNIAFSISFIKTLNKEDIRRENCDIIFLLCDINEISSDKHLLFLEKYESVKILSPKDFWLVYTGQKDDDEEWKKIFKNILGIDKK